MAVAATSTQDAILGRGEGHEYPLWLVESTLLARNKRHLEQPLYYSGRWWAQRLAVVTSWMIQQALPADRGIVFDPFLGSGTTVGEALRLNHAAIGAEINPYAAAVVRRALQQEHSDLGAEYRRVVDAALSEINPLYEDADTGLAGYFWAYERDCPGCGLTTLLLNRRVIVQHAYRHRNSAGWAICPHSRHVFPVKDVNASKAKCPCGRFVALTVARGGVRFRCSACRSHVEPWGQDTSPVPPRAVLIAVEQRERSDRIFRPPTPEEADRAGQNGGNALPPAPIIPGRSTRQVLRWGYTDWRQLLHPRQQALGAALADQVRAVADDDLREALAIALSPFWDYHSRLCSFKGIGTGSIRQGFGSPTIHPVPVSYEANPLYASKGFHFSGDLRGWYSKRTARSAKARAALADGRGGVELGGVQEVLGGRADAAILCADSASIQLPPDSIDAIVTDPPYFDRIEYDDLAGAFVAWFGWCGVDCQSTLRGVQSSDRREFATRLGAALKPAVAALKSGGSLVFTYHHQKPEAWVALAGALEALPVRALRVDVIPADVPHSPMKQRAAMPITTDAVLHLVKEARSADPMELDAWVLQAKAQIGSVPGATAGDRASAAYAFAVGAYLAHRDPPPIEALLSDVRGSLECPKA